MTTRARRSPLPFTLFLAALALGLVAAAPEADLPVHWALIGGPLAVALAVAGGLQVKFQYRDHVEAIDLFESALLPLLFLFPAPVVVPATALAKAASQAALRVPRTKAAFNVAQWSAAAATASAVFADIAPGGHGRPETGSLAALLVAALVLMAVNHAAVVTVIGIVERRPVAAVLGDLNPVIVPGWLVGAATNLAFGLLFTLSISAWAGASTLVLVPLGVLHWATRAYAAVRADRARLAALQAATHELGVPVDPRDAVGPFLDRVRDCFEAGAVELVVLDARSVTHRPEADTVDPVPGLALAAAVAASGAPIRVRRPAGDPLATLVVEAGHRDAIAVPLRREGRVVGALVSYDRDGMEGFEDGEVAVLEALAGELAAALHRSDLLAQIIDERTKLAAIVNRSSDGIFTVARDGTITSWNPAMTAMTGFAETDMVTTARLPLLTPRDAGGAAIEAWATSGLDLPDRIEIATRTGEPRWLDCTYGATAGTDHNILVVVARDVTRARELEQLKDDFIASVSHELRTPLTTIAGYSQMLVEDGPDMTQEDRDDAAVVIGRGARRLERLVLNLLEVSRIESQRPEPIRSPIDVNELCDQVADELRRTWTDRHIAVTRGPGAVRALGNELSVDQILHNLVGNALKYAPGSPVEVVVEEGVDAIRIHVRDHGAGVPPDAVDRIFERFERLDQASEQPGTGLGLYIARQLARGMHGDLAVTPSPGGGATFTLRLPAVAFARA